MYIAPPGKVQPRRMARSSAAAHGVAQQASLALLTDLAPSKARVAKLAAPGTPCASSARPPTAPSPSTSSPSSHKTSGVLRRARPAIATAGTASELWHPEDPGVYVVWLRFASEGGDNTHSEAVAGSVAPDKGGEEGSEASLAAGRDEGHDERSSVCGYRKPNPRGVYRRSRRANHTPQGRIPGGKRER